MQTMKGWAGYKRCDFYQPLCEHCQDIVKEYWGMCKFYYYPEAYCSEADNCDGYGWRGMTHKETIKTKFDIAERIP